MSEIYYTDEAFLSSLDEGEGLTPEREKEIRAVLDHGASAGFAEQACRDLLAALNECRQERERAEHLREHFDLAFQKADAEREQYRIEADCGLRDYDALELDFGIACEALEKAEAALAACDAERTKAQEALEKLEDETRWARW